MKQSNIRKRECFFVLPALAARVPPTVLCVHLMTKDVNNRDDYESSEPSPKAPYNF